MSGGSDEGGYGGDHRPSHIASTKLQPIESTSTKRPGLAEGEAFPPGSAPGWGLGSGQRGGGVGLAVPRRPLHPSGPPLGYQHGTLSRTAQVRRSTTRVGGFSVERFLGPWDASSPRTPPAAPIRESRFCWGPGPRKPRCSFPPGSRGRKTRDSSARFHFALAFGVTLR